jgi:hypothetical protein
VLQRTKFGGINVLLLQILVSAQLAFGSNTEAALQKRVDEAFFKIFQSQIGQTICRDILGADAGAISTHLGVSPDEAKKLALQCAQGDFEPGAMVYPTSPADIQKIAHLQKSQRTYTILPAVEGFEIESWTDPRTNTTTILQSEEGMDDARLLQILVHEMAVYFDSKINPAHANAQSIPHLRSLSLKGPGRMNPLVAVTNPLVGHTLTYLRALQLEFAIIDELLQAGIMKEAPEGYHDAYLRYLASDSCAHQCIELLILELQQKVFLPISLPLLAHASHYRALRLDEFKRMTPQWTSAQWISANESLDRLPVLFFNATKGISVVDSMKMVASVPESQRADFVTVESFMKDTLLKIEWPVVSQSRFDSSGITLLEFMKRPLLSGYNIVITSGPRVRVRSGLIE